MNAIELLKNQHREVEQLFLRAKSLEGDEKIQILGQIAEALTLHAVLEEQYFYPLLRQHGLAEDSTRSLNEHAQVKLLVSELLRAKQTDPRLDQLLDQLANSVRTHVEAEEQDILPRALSAIDRKLFDAAGREMQDAISRLQQQELLKMAEHQGMPPPPGAP